MCHKYLMDGTSFCEVWCLKPFIDCFVRAYKESFSVSLEKYRIYCKNNCPWYFKMWQRKYFLSHLSSNWFTRQCIFFVKWRFCWDWFLWSQWQELSIDVADWFVQFNQTVKVFRFPFTHIFRLFSTFISKYLTIDSMSVLT